MISKDWLTFWNTWPLMVPQLRPSKIDLYFQSIGMQFGAHVNASTGFENTTYKLEIPTDDLEIFKTNLSSSEGLG